MQRGKNIGETFEEKRKDQMRPHFRAVTSLCVLCNKRLQLCNGSVGIFYVCVEDANSTFKLCPTQAEFLFFIDTFESGQY